MPRTTEALVKAILLANYDGRRTPSLTAFIRTANVVTSRVLAMSVKKPRVLAGGGLTTDELREIETLLAAHFYCVNDPLYSSRSTQGASGSFQRAGAKEGFSSTDYGKQAMDVDWSGVLKNINMQQFASGTSMGHHPDMLETDADLTEAADGAT